MQFFKRVGNFVGSLFRNVASDSKTLVDLAKVVRFLGFAFTSGRNQFEAPPIDFFTLMRAYNSDGYIRQAVDKHINLMFKAGWNLVGKNDRAVRYVQSRLRLMAFVTGVPIETFFAGIAADLVKYANVFLVKARVKRPVIAAGVRASPVSKRGVVGAYFGMHPGTVRIKRDENGHVLQYQQQVAGKTKEFSPEDIVHIYFNRDAGLAFGVPFLHSVIEDVRLLRQVEENVALLLYRHIFPFLHYTVGLDAPGKEGTDEEIELVRELVMNMPTDGALVTSERHKITPIRLEPIEAEPYLEYFENRVFAGLGVSQVAMGRGDTSSRSTAESMLVQMQDQIKAMQRVMASFIDLHIINELLLEGGFNPVGRPEDEVRFVFNEIDLDSLIKKENHEVFKFEHNAQTFEEMRRNLGLEIGVDESRLYFRMISIPLAEAKALALGPSVDDTDNRNAPSNKKEGAGEEFIFAGEAAGLQVRLGCADAARRLQGLYAEAKGDVVQLLQQSGTEVPSGQVLGVLRLTADRMIRYLVAFIEKSYTAGVYDAAGDIPGNVGRPGMPAELRFRVYRYINNFVDDTWGLIRDALNDMESNEQAARVVARIFDRTAYRLGSIASYEVPLARNYGYALIAVKNGHTTLEVVHTEGCCEGCRGREMVNLSSSNIADVIPPWHPFCGCYVRVKV
ncbi:MAG: hypothetical protein AB1330_01345 [Bacillota bacterium]